MLCNYGCGQEAQHTLKNGKECCSKHHNSCPARRKQNSTGQKKAYEEGKRHPIFTDEHRAKSAATRKDLCIEKVFVENSNATNSTVRELLFEFFDVRKECQNCQLSEWQGVELPLELDHINGKSRDNRLENLRLLCPNCHSITPTWRGKNINNGKTKVTDEKILTAFEKCGNIRQTLIEVGLAPKGANYTRVKKLLNR